MNKAPLIGATLLLAAGSANAAELGYTYVDFSYDSVTLEDSGFDVDGDRISLDGSFALNRMLFIEAGYKTPRRSTNRVSRSTTTYSTQASAPVTLLATMSTWSAASVS